MVLVWRGVVRMRWMDRSLEKRSGILMVVITNEKVG